MKDFFISQCQVTLGKPKLILITLQRSDKGNTEMQILVILSARETLLVMLFLRPRGGPGIMQFEQSIGTLIMT